MCVTRTLHAFSDLDAQALRQGVGWRTWLHAWMVGRLGSAQPSSAA